MLVVNGKSPTGVTSSSGVFLDGAGNGVPGSDYVRVFGREVLAGPNPMDSRRTHVVAHPSRLSSTPPVRLSLRKAAHPMSAGAHRNGSGSKVVNQATVRLHPSLVDAALEGIDVRSRR
jgi:hypothetical protein